MDEVVRDDAIVAGIRSVPHHDCGCVLVDANDEPSPCGLLDITPKITNAATRAADVHALMEQTLIGLRDLDISPAVTEAAVADPLALCEAIGNLDRALRQVQIVGDNVILAMLAVAKVVEGAFDE